ncbi:hypothetical protein [Brevibacillus sp. SYSU BS000544]|uniref:hypothetical protein n=1 Tax=Brevibacillus sp. SYSU BS000544 TaxID=3416443 RepID=UPI003CE5B3FD
MKSNNGNKLQPLDHSQLPEAWQRLYEEIRKAVQVEENDECSANENKMTRKERY